MLRFHGAKIREWVLGCNMPRAKSRILVELPKCTNAATPRSSLKGMDDQNSMKMKQLSCVFKDMRQNTEITQITILCLCDIIKATNLEHGEELHGLLLIKHLKNQMNERDVQKRQHDS